MLEMQGVSNTITGASEMQLETTMKTPETQNSFCAFISTLADWAEGPVEKIRYRKLRAVDRRTLKDVGLNRAQVLMPPKH